MRTKILTPKEKEILLMLLDREAERVDNSCNHIGIKIHSRIFIDNLKAKIIRL